MFCKLEHSVYKHSVVYFIASVNQISLVHGLRKLEFQQLQLPVKRQNSVLVSPFYNTLGRNIVDRIILKKITNLKLFSITAA